MSATATSKPESRTEEFSDRVEKYPKEEFEPYSVQGDVIGSGGYGNVRKYRHENKIVAIKEFIIAGDEEAINSIWNTLSQEANILCRFHHKNIVEILGVTHWTDGVGIIMEYIDGGNLQTLLSLDNKRELSWNNRLKIAEGITSGLDYLHNYGEKKTFCHGDLKPAKILLTKLLQVKLTDFGSAAFHRATGASSTTISHISSKQFTLIYVAPEFLEDNTHERNPAMDMYSFGMVLYELITGSPPYSDCSMPAHVPALILAKIKPSAKLIDGVENQLKSDDDQEAFNFLKNLMKKCWNDLPASRLCSRRATSNLSRYLKQGPSSPIDDIETFGVDDAADEREDIADYIIPKNSACKMSTLDNALKTADSHQGALSRCFIEDNYNAKSFESQSLLENYSRSTSFGNDLQKQSTGDENIEKLGMKMMLKEKRKQSFQDVFTIEDYFTTKSFASLSLFGINKSSTSFVKTNVKDFLSELQHLSTPLSDATEPIFDESASQIRRSEPDSVTALIQSIRNAKTVSSVDSFEAEISSRLSKNPNDGFEVHRENSNLFSKSSCPEFGRFHDKVVKIFTIKRVSIASGAKQAIETWNMIKIQARLLLQFRHPNLVEVMEIIERPNALGIVMEYVDGGNLRERLSKSNYSDLSWENRVKIAQELVSALSYIHNFANDKKLCHGYIKSENVLLTNGLVVKLANFGTDRFMHTTTDTTINSELIPTKEQTIAYVAPEFLLDPTQSKNPAIDMYSFGSVLYELICKKPPYHDCTEQLSLMLNLIRDGQKPDMKPIYQKKKELQTADDRAAFHLLKTLMLRCWNANPASRPCSKQVEEEINTYFEKQQQNQSSPVHETKRFAVEVEVAPGGVATQNEQVAADTKATTDGLSTASTETENAAISKNISSVIGPNGGVIEGGGCRLVFPKGALKSEVPIKLYSTYGGNNVMEGLATTLLRCEPSGQKFNKKIIFRLYTCYITDEPAVVQVRRSKDGKHWENIKQFHHTDERFFEFSIKGFSWFAAFFQDISLWWQSELRKLLTSWIPKKVEARDQKILKCFVDDDVPDMKRKPTDFEQDWKLIFFAKKAEEEVVLRLSVEQGNQLRDVTISPSSCHLEIFRVQQCETSFLLHWINRSTNFCAMIISVQTKERSRDQRLHINPPQGALPGEGNQQIENLGAGPKYITNVYGSPASVGDQSSVHATTNVAPPHESHQKPEAENQSAPLPATLR